MNKVKSATPQNDIVLKHLRTVGHITNAEAQVVHGIRSVSSRISELQRAGHAIKKETKYDLKGQRYTKYTLGKEPAAKATPGFKIGDRVVMSRITNDLGNGDAYIPLGSVGVVQSIDDEGDYFVDFPRPRKLWYCTRRELSLAA